MQNIKQGRKFGVRRPNVRCLKIQSRIRDTRWSRNIAPEIKLCGNWLEELGFEYGKKGGGDDDGGVVDHKAASRVNSCYPSYLSNHTIIF